TLTGLGELTTFWFFGESGQTVCAPRDDAFQQWLVGIADAIGPNCTSLAIESSEPVPITKFALRGNYPNPFRSGTSIIIELPEPTRSRVEVLDVTGRRVMDTPVLELNPGRQMIPIRAQGLSSGVYFFRVLLEAPGEHHVLTGRMLLIR
ncbi:MAG: T9SS type A sorting domain-containing protein, partial [Bacteroidetes bacterium]|nr:T9SS type A sorting domain-containing protein [Bacteroidota bacterium]